MSLVAGLDFGGGAVKACVADVATGVVLSVAQQATVTSHPAPGRAEFEPDAWWAAASAAMREAVAAAGRPAAEYAAVTVTSLRQGYVLLDEEAEIGCGVVNSDRRGAGQLDRVRDTIGAERLYDVTGHWSAPQLTLPKLLDEQQSSPERWDRTRTVLFVHDWALWRLSGERVSEPSMASAGQLLDVRSRSWASDLLGELGLAVGVLPPLADPASIVGGLRDGGLGLPMGIPVVVGGADTQMAAAGAGGLEPGVVSVVAGTTTPLQASTAEAPTDPLRHPWVSTHLLSDRWAVETNAGYTGMSFDWLASLTGRSVAELADEAAQSEPGAAGISAVVAARSWNEEAWSNRAPNALVGFEPRHRLADVAQAFLEAHAYGIRGNLEDLERGMGESLGQVCLLGGAARSRAFVQLVADVTARSISHVDSTYPAGRAFAWLAARAAGTDTPPPTFSGETVEPQLSDRYEEGYLRYAEAGDAVQRELTGWAA
jgi:sugar (pentulose or hexulose) kinase